MITSPLVPASADPSVQNSDLAQAQPMNHFLTSSDSDAALLGERLSASLLVVGLCAQWCSTCREFAPLFNELAMAHPGATFVWLDVEDDSELAGEIDVDNFPTLAVYRDGLPVHFGISLPQLPVVARLIGALAQAEARVVDVARPVRELPALLAQHARSASA